MLASSSKSQMQNKIVLPWRRKKYAWTVWGQATSLDNTNHKILIQEVPKPNHNLLRHLIAHGDCQWWSSPCSGEGFPFFQLQLISTCTHFNKLFVHNKWSLSSCSRWFYCRSLCFLVHRKVHGSPDLLTFTQISWPVSQQHPYFCCTSFKQEIQCHNMCIMCDTDSRFQPHSMKRWIYCTTRTQNEDLVICLYKSCLNTSPFNVIKMPQCCLI